MKKIQKLNLKFCLCIFVYLVNFFERGISIYNIIFLVPIQANLLFFETLIELKNHLYDLRYKNIFIGTTQTFYFFLSTNTKRNTKLNTHTQHTNK